MSAVLIGEEIVAVRAGFGFREGSDQFARIGVSTRKGEVLEAAREWHRNLSCRIDHPAVIDITGRLMEREPRVRPRDEGGIRRILGRIRSKVEILGIAAPTPWPRRCHRRLEHAPEALPPRGIEVIEPKVNRVGILAEPE